MSKIKFDKISENEVKVTLSESTPLEMVDTLVKSMTSKGLNEDLAKSTLTTRYFYKDKALDAADNLLKALEEVAKAKKLPWWASHQYEVDEWKNKNAALDRQAKVKQNISATPQKISPPAPTGAPKTLPNVPAKIHNPNLSGKVDYYNKVKKDEDGDIEKSGYGPKGGGQYSVADNVNRKMKNTAEEVDTVGPNKSVKQYTSAKFSSKTPQTDPKLKKPQPVKVFSQEEKDELARKMNLKKSWANHHSIPSAEANLKKNDSPTEDIMAQQLANLMSGKAMLGQENRQPTSEDMIMAGEAMGLGIPEQEIKKSDNKWNSTMNDWLKEATKPISQRFASEEEEIAYWNSIKVADRDDREPGY